MKLYIERHDGEAATIENFLQAFEDASGRDLSQFALWYHQAGTPNLAVTTAYDPEIGEFRIEIEQSVPPTPSESRKRLMHIPLAFGLVGEDGKDIEPSAVEGAAVENGVIHVRKRRHVLRFEGVPQRPALSLNRGFSAPVTLSFEQRPDDLLFLARKDSDLVARWLALNTLFTGALIQGFRAVRGQKKPQFGEGLIRAAGEIAADETLEPAWRALALTLPGEADIAREIGSNIDPDAIFAAREALSEAIAAENRGTFATLHEGLEDAGPFSPDATSAGRRALRNVLNGPASSSPSWSAAKVPRFSVAIASDSASRAAKMASGSMFEPISRAMSASPGSVSASARHAGSSVSSAAISPAARISPSPN